MDINKYHVRFTGDQILVINHISLLGDFGDEFYYYVVEMREEAKLDSKQSFITMSKRFQERGTVYVWGRSPEVKDNKREYYLVINKYLYLNEILVSRKEIKPTYLMRLGQIILEMIGEESDHDSNNIGVYVSMRF